MDACVNKQKMVVIKLCMDDFIISCTYIIPYYKYCVIFVQVLGKY